MCGRSEKMVTFYLPKTKANFFHFVFFLLQSNLSTTATLGTPKKWPLYTGDRSVEVFQWKLLCNLVKQALGRPLLTGGRYSEVVVNTGLTVYSDVKLLRKADQKIKNLFEFLLFLFADVLFVHAQFSFQMKHLYLMF
jgi:hypothetical protein